MVPAQQRLEAGDATGGQLDDRLVVQHELVAGERAPQVCLELASLKCLLVHARLEDDVRALATLLGLVHRDVGVAHQLVGRVDERAHRDTDARLGERLAVGELERLAHRAKHPLGHLDGLVRRTRLLEQKGELVASEPGGCVGWAKARPKARGDALEQLVAGCMGRGSR